MIKLYVMRSDFPLGDWSSDYIKRTSSVPFESSEENIVSALQAAGAPCCESIECIEKVAQTEVKHFLKIIELRCKFANGTLNLADIRPEDRSKVEYIKGMEFPVDELRGVQKEFRDEYRADVYEITIRKIGTVDSQGKLREEKDKK